MIRKSRKKNTDLAKEIEKKAKNDIKLNKKVIEAVSPKKHDLVDRAPLYHILDDIRDLIDEKPVDDYSFQNIESALRKTLSKVRDADK